jgi:hypothetical protein
LGAGWGLTTGLPVFFLFVVVFAMLHKYTQELKIISPETAPNAKRHPWVALAIFIEVGY